jgi:phage shock protein A
MMRLRALDKQITDMQSEQEKLQDTERRLSSKVEEFNSKKEVIKAQYSAAEAEVRIKESVTGISEEMADVGIAMNKAEEKAEKMKAKSQALDEMIDSGVLTDYTSNTNDDGSAIEKELEDVASQRAVDEELAKLKAERSKKKKLGDRSDDVVEEQETEEVQQAAT